MIVRESLRLLAIFDWEKCIVSRGLQIWLRVKEDVLDFTCDSDFWFCYSILCYFLSKTKIYIFPRFQAAVKSNSNTLFHHNKINKFQHNEEKGFCNWINQIQGCCITVEVHFKRTKNEIRIHGWAIQVRLLVWTFFAQLEWSPTLILQPEI